ncbi:hypothetical protein AB0H92_24225 [Streptomyces phaeochromogenes]|uniref:hypothetical protein n=1 Tax=Streptomyces phaeochromogenes TaxID=1923 RepID=UPI0033FEB6F6
MRMLWPPFIPDSRANQLKKYAYTSDPGTENMWLWLCGPQEVAKQVDLLGKCTPLTVTGESKAQWTHLYHLTRGDESTLTSLCQILKSTLCLTTKPNLDFAIAFDWYKLVEGDDPMKWPNTASGALVSQSKYNAPRAVKAKARNELVDKYVQTINAHPLYRDCVSIVTVPGHRADGNSFGEQLAAAVATRCQKTLVRTASPGGARPEAKGGTAEIADGHFTVSGARGDVLILDDVYRSGTTMNSVAGAAKRGGATRVFGLAAVRTRRN